MTETDAKRRRMDDGTVEKETTECLATLMDMIEDMEDGTDEGLVDASVLFLKIKSLQREVLDGLETMADDLSRAQAKAGEDETECDNLRYLKNHHEHAERLHRQADTSNLLQLARDTGNSGNHNSNKEGMDSMDVDAETAKDTSEGTSDNGDEQLIRTFLRGSDPSDPSQKAAVLERLQNEIQERTELTKRREAISSLVVTTKKKLELKQRLLKDLPHKLQDMERSSVPLQKFFHEAVNPSLKKIGTERDAFLAKAESTLPRPLYTLFHQLQSCLDSALPDQTLSGSRLQEVHPTLEIGQSGNSLRLKMPVPTVTSNGATFVNAKKLATIRFEVDSASGLVVADSTPRSDMALLVHELFPNDDGEAVVAPTTDSQKDKAQTENDNDSGDGNLDHDDKTEASSVKSKSTSTSPFQRPYHWCNYIAGIHLASENTVNDDRDDDHGSGRTDDCVEDGTDRNAPTPHRRPSKKVRSLRHHSTHAIMGRLKRRIQSMSTLSWSIQCISRNPQSIPILDRLADMVPSTLSAGSAKAVSFKETTSKSKSLDTADDATFQLQRRTFDATITKNGFQVTATVQVHMSQYPTVPPIWKFAAFNTQEQWGEKFGTLKDLSDDRQRRVYDDRIAQLERQANTEVLRMMAEKCGNDDVCYDWVLNVQLMRIVQGWNEIVLD